MRTFLQIQEEIFDTLKQEKGTDKFWNEQEVKNAINDTYHFIADETFCFKFDHVIEIKAGIRTYKLPEFYIIGSLSRVEFDGKRIYPVTADELDAYVESWRDESGDPRNYLPPGDISASDEIVLYPNPSTDGAVYNLASESQDYGVVTTVGDDTYEEFNEEEGVIVATDGDAKFEETEGTGPVLDIRDISGNIVVYGAKYPKRLYNDNEVFLHPLSYNPKRLIDNGALAILFSKEGEGKDIQKASYYNKRFMEAIDSTLRRPKLKRTHVMRSITQISTGNYMDRGSLNLGSHYPSYFMR